MTDDTHTDPVYQVTENIYNRYGWGRQELPWLCFVLSVLSHLTGALPEALIQAVMFQQLCSLFVGSFFFSPNLATKQSFAELDTQCCKKNSFLLFRINED